MMTLKRYLQLPEWQLEIEDLLFAGNRIQLEKATRREAMKGKGLAKVGLWVFNM